MLLFVFDCFARCAFYVLGKIVLVIIRKSSSSSPLSMYIPF